MDFIDIKHLCLGCMSPIENPNLPCQNPKCHWKRGTPNSELQLQPGTLLESTAGTFIIGRALGQGGFGITYIAGDINNKIKVAIKEYFPSKIVAREPDKKTVRLLSDDLDNRHLLKRGIKDLYREADTLAKFVDDPNIVTVRAIFKKNNTAYIVMEFVEGQTFKEMLANIGKPISLIEVVTQLEPIMKALTKVHEAGIVHRDISPDNIIIENDGTVKLIDFGAARSLSMEGEKSLTVMFKMGYAPPEQFQTHGKQGPWTDVYALAATIYHAVTGQKPVSTTDRWMGIDTLEMPSSIPGVIISPQGEQAILKGMALKIEERYQSVKEFYKALKEALPGSLEKGTDTPKKKEVKTNSFSLGKALIIGFMVALIGGVGVNVHRSSPKTQPVSPIETQQEESSETQIKNDIVSPQSDLSLDSISIGMSTSKIESLIGKSSKSYTDRLPGYVINEYSDMQVYIKDGIVRGMYSNNFDVKTRRGIHPGTQEKEIEKSYGVAHEITNVDNSSKVYIYKFNSDDNIPSFLHFFVTDNKVKYIEIETQPLAELAGAIQFLRYFHERITARDFEAAYGCFSDNMKRQIGDYNEWVAGYKTTVKSEIAKLTAIDQSKENRVKLFYVLRAVDSPGGESFFTGEITFIKLGDYFKIDSIENKAN